MAAGQGLTRPELAVLVAYGKMVLKEQLNCPEVIDEPFLANMLITSFPAKLQQRFGAQLAGHPLRGEIIATRVANMLVNDMGLNFASRMKDETGASVAEVACCFAMAREVFGMNRLWRDIEGCDNLMGAETQLELMFYSRRIVRRATRWFLRARNRSWSISENIAFFRPAFETLGKHLYDVMDESEVAEHRQAVAKWMEKEVPEAIARQVAHMSSLFSSLDLAQIAAEHKTDILRAANVYYRLGAKLDLHWFLEQINHQPVGKPLAGDGKGLVSVKIWTGSNAVSLLWYWKGAKSRENALPYWPTGFRSMSNSCPVGPICWPTSRPRAPTSSPNSRWPCES